MTSPSPDQSQSHGSPTHEPHKATCLHVRSSQPRLLPNRPLVESQLITLENVSIDTTALARSRADNGIQSSGLELTLQRRLDLPGLLQTSLALGLYAVADLGLLGLGGALLALASAADGGAVVSFVPGAEGSSVDLHHGGLGQGVCADEFVVGGMVGDDDDANLAGNALTAPGEVAALQTQGSVFGVATSGAHKMDSLVADTGVGWLTALLESSVVQKTMLDCLLFKSLSSHCLSSPHAQWDWV